jgi:hypothetical protein
LQRLHALCNCGIGVVVTPTLTTILISVTPTLTTILISVTPTLTTILISVTPTLTTILISVTPTLTTILISVTAFVTNVRRRALDIVTVEVRQWSDVCHCVRHSSRIVAARRQWVALVSPHFSAADPATNIVFTLGFYSDVGFAFDSDDVDTPFRSGIGVTASGSDACTVV